ncbi:MAG: GHKL domain-containing protein [Clostridia bacterium]|nr:GHKL domain-containing protein [Clostridia bacterium]
MKKRNLYINILENLDKKSKIIIIFNFIAAISVLCIQILVVFYYIDNLPPAFGLLLFISLLAYFIISNFTLLKSNQLFTTTQALHSAEEYNKTLQIIHDSVRGFKHDFDNIVMTIGGYIHTNDIEGLKAYYSNLQEDCQVSNNLYMLNPTIVNDPGIYNLLTNKYYKAEDKNVKINFSFLLDFTKLNMNIYEFTRILGILIDNAIEASTECDEKIVNISFRYEEKNNRQIVLIENTYNDIGIDMEKLFDKGVSGKENHSGIGLWEVRKIIKKHKNLNLYTNKNNKYFIQQLEIYN